MQEFLETSSVSLCSFCAEFALAKSTLFYKNIFLKIQSFYQVSDKIFNSMTQQQYVKVCQDWILHPDFSVFPNVFLN